MDAAAAAATTTTHSTNSTSSISTTTDSCDHQRHRIAITGRMSAKIYRGELRGGRAVVVKAVRIDAAAASPSPSSPSSSAAAAASAKAKASTPLATDADCDHNADADAADGDAPPPADPWREWRITKRLQALAGHPHVVELLEAYANKQHVFLVMEFCDQGDLLKLLTDQPGSRVPPARALALLLQIARGLQYLHAHQIAHRDISLENVFVHRGACKLGDFGLSAPADVPSRDCVGKTQYVAPEAVLSQAAAGSAYDPVKADIWSLGVVFFMMLTGSPLVDFASPLSDEFRAFRKVGVRGVLRAWHMEDALSFATLDLLARMLHVDPAKRFQSTQELLDHPSLLAAARREDQWS